MKRNLGKNTRRFILSFLGSLTTAAIFYGGGNYNKWSVFYISGAQRDQPA